MYTLLLHDYDLNLDITIRIICSRKIQNGEGYMVHAKTETHVLLSQQKYKEFLTLNNDIEKMKLFFERLTQVNKVLKNGQIKQLPDSPRSLPVHGKDDTFRSA